MFSPLTLPLYCLTSSQVNSGSQQTNDTILTSFSISAGIIPSLFPVRSSPPSPSLNASFSLVPRTNTCLEGIPAPSLVFLSVLFFPHFIPSFFFPHDAWGPLMNTNSFSSLRWLCNLPLLVTFSSYNIKAGQRWNVFLNSQTTHNESYLICLDPKNWNTCV